jgi:tryptophanyl-tRNA synthetase
MSNADQRPIILTGDRPTGQLHLGHFVGSLRLVLVYKTVIINTYY